MSKPIFQDIFKLSSRRNRKSYILFELVTLAGIGLIGAGGLTLISAIGDGTVLAGIIFYTCAVLISAILVSAWLASAQRVRDFGYSGWWALVQLVPYIGPVFSIALWFIPSSKGENKYGPSPI